ncbi:hypothetical protein DVDV_1929 [Desulfovibrio sp. DV]|nr:hypothetical protein DVDV_1929 [Desulfovibrio sp. DV]
MGKIYEGVHAKGRITQSELRKIEERTNPIEGFQRGRPLWPPEALPLTRIA